MIAVFGPVPSRRLGRSLGVNHLPPQVCSYSWAYCQIGPTLVRASEPEPRCAPELIHEQVRDRLATLRRRGEPVDYVTFVPEGEPCLDRNLGASIDAVRTLGVPIAVITNGSLLWRPEVRERLLKADCVSGVRRRLSRPAPDRNAAGARGERRCRRAGSAGDLPGEPASGGRLRLRADASSGVRLGAAPG
jgi:hypothetical protein